MKTKYCKNCKVLIERKRPSLLDMFSFGLITFYEFEDGTYCRDCGVIRKIKHEKAFIELEEKK